MSDVVGTGAWVSFMFVSIFAGHLARPSKNNIDSQAHQNWNANGDKP
ncbi:MAG: hypothetical protein WA322_24195 [Pseudolabrys sp.]